MTRKYSIFILSLLFCLFFNPIYASAEEEYNKYPLGLTYEEIQEFKVDEDVYIIPMPDVDVYGMSSNLDYTIDEEINLSNGVLYDYLTSLQNNSGSMDFGEFITVTSGGNGYLVITLYNSGQPLFSENGVFNFMIQSYSTGGGNTAKITYSFTDGNTFEDTYTPTYGTDEFIEYTIENPSATLSMVEIRMSPNATMGLGIKKYGYIIDKPEEDHSKNIFELLVEWTGNFFDNMIESIKSALPDVGSEETSELGNSLSEYESVESDVLDPALDSMESFDFESNSIDSLGTGFVAAITFISSFLQTLYDLTPFSVVFALIATLGLASICIGLSRLWFGKKGR